MAGRQAYQAQFEAGAASVRSARRAVTSVAERWGCDQLADDLALATSELASNAVLHTRDAFGLLARPITGGAHVEIIDRRPDLRPMVMPALLAGSGLDLQGSTGRGLQIVAALASRWGFRTSRERKAVWFEIVSGSAVGTDPVIELGHEPPPDPGARQYRLLQLPVAAAVASGMHVDDLVRELQLTQPAAVSPAERERLDELLDASAAARLEGRHAALDAAASGADRYDLTIDVAQETVVAFAALNELLTTLGERIGSSGGAASPDVLAFRQWLLQEVAAQAAGQPPTPCPLPT